MDTKSSLVSIKEFLIKYLGRIDFFTGATLKVNEVDVRQLISSSELHKQGIFNYIITSKYNNINNIFFDDIVRLNQRNKELIELVGNEYTKEEQQFIHQLKIDQSLGLMEHLFNELCVDFQVINEVKDKQEYLEA